jgi:hypothetical protein
MGNAEGVECVGLCERMDCGKFAGSFGLCGCVANVWVEYARRRRRWVGWGSRLIA